MPKNLTPLYLKNEGKYFRLVLSKSDCRELLYQDQSNEVLQQQPMPRYILKTGWLIDGPNIPGRPFWVMRHRTPLLT